MKNKKSKIFLLIGFAIFFISAIVMLISVITSYNDLSDDPQIRGWEIVIAKFFVIFIFPPILAEELSWIRSTYKLLKHNPKGFIKICYIIASGISFFAMILQLLMFTNVIDFDKMMPDKINPQLTVLLVSPYIATILSFLLGSMPVKSGSDMTNEQETLS